MQLIHLGLVMIRVHALHHRNAGVNALVVLRDTRWTDDRSIIGTMEVDLSGGIHAVSAAPRTIAELQGMRWTLQPSSMAQIRVPQEVRTTTLLDGSIALSFQGYQSTRHSQPRRMSNLDIEEIRDEGEEEFIGMFSNEYIPKTQKTQRTQPIFSSKYVEHPQKPQPIWDTLGEPSGKYDYYVDYSIPARPPEYYLPIIPTGWEDDNDEVPMSY
ncbi:uncharacterized protein LOC141832867 [Curcuma longa]|uniref:uncharacterized protein LOC141832867 n=1 Tax=Curcuma longa TaxID=136217 RepID=UPI003D9DC187